ncbi:hypothetical protein NSS70_07155 [Aeribacillus sp. FSL K6-2848]|uniref:hypothetical protein n=1 Tax=Aeribacillus sp. FSL K6-2848 TaxID=2954612 RepID=UPI0030FAD47D
MNLLKVRLDHQTKANLPTPQAKSSNDENEVWNKKKRLVISFMKNLYVLTTVKSILMAVEITECMRGTFRFFSSFYVEFNLKSDTDAFEGLRHLSRSYFKQVRFLEKVLPHNHLNKKLQLNN